MKKIIFLMISVLIIAGCQSREKKVSKLVKQEMFKTLYDFESYEPIETKTDSAFSSIYADSTIRMHAYIARFLLDDIEENLSKIKDDQSTMEIWGDSYTSLSRRKYNEAYNDYKTRMERVNKAFERVNVRMDSIRILSKDFKQEFIGWRATHKFRCKTKGGNFDLGNYAYTFDKEIKTIINKEDLDENDNEKLISLINEAINSESEKETDSNTGATKQNQL